MTKGNISSGAAVCAGTEPAVRTAKQAKSLYLFMMSSKTRRRALDYPVRRWMAGFKTFGSARSSSD
jgi:hypothetical protein